MSEEAPPAEHKIDLRRDVPAVAFMGFLFLASIGLALAFSITYNALNIRAFEDPDSLANPLIYLGIVVVFTIGILLIAKYGRRILIKYVVLGSILTTIYYVAWPLLATTIGVGDPFGPAEIIGGVLAIGLTALLWFYPEWYVIDMTGIAVSAGAAGIFGISFGILPCLILLVVFAVYDAIAVYRTRHMLALADSVLELRLPIMFVVPKTLKYSFLEETRRLKVDKPKPGDEAGGKGQEAGGAGPAGTEAKGEDAPRDAMFMGLGDAVIPGTLVVSAFTFLPNEAAYAVMGLAGPFVVALAAVLGGLIGFLILMYFVVKGTPHAGLPLLNGGTIAGFLLTLVPLYGFGPLWPF